MLAFLVWISDLAARGGGDDAERTSYFVRPNYLICSIFKSILANLGPRKWIKKTVFSQNPENPQSDCFRMFKLIFVCSKYDFWIPEKVLDRRR